MASGWINTLKFKACLKFPDQYSTARVDLCTDVLGRHIVVKYVPKDNKEVGDSSSEPEGLIYEVYVSLEGLELVQNIPKLIDSDVHTNGGHTWYRQAYEYCHGSDLEELVSYATAEGQHLPEDFIWHIIK